MSRTTCEIGNRVKLRTSAAQSTLSSPFGIIVGLLPAEDRGGEARYRIKVDGETFERSVLATDIEHAETTQGATGAAITGPWLKPLSTKSAK